MIPRTVVALLLACAACASPAADVGNRPSPSEEPERERRFDDLTFTLEVESPAVRAGAEFTATMIVANRSGHDVVDPGCWLAASRAAVVPPDDPDAELWLQVVVDCEGSRTIRPGEEERHVLTLVAATKYGEPLAPGDYVVAVEYRGLSRRIETPVRVT